LAFVASKRLTRDGPGAAIRGAWFAGFCAVTIPIAVDALAGRSADVELTVAIGPAAWVSSRGAAIGVRSLHMVPRSIVRRSTARGACGAQ
jgi:hypothetical protein